MVYNVMAEYNLMIRIRIHTKPDKRWMDKYDSFADYLYERTAWCWSNIGGAGHHSWYYSTIDRNNYWFSFYKQEDALAFKLKFGEMSEYV